MIGLSEEIDANSGWKIRNVLMFVFRRVAFRGGVGRECPAFGHGQVGEGFCVAPNGAERGGSATRDSASGSITSRAASLKEGAGRGEATTRVLACKLS